MLTEYQLRTNRLLQYPVATPGLYATSDLDDWINQARGWVAGEGECIRIQGTFTTTVGVRNYNFSLINTGTPSSNGVQGVIHVRDVLYAVASGFKRVNPRNWEWYQLYHLNNPVPASGPPTTWAQYGQGSAGLGSITGAGSGSLSSGSLYLDPPPDIPYEIMLDCVCYPIALATDTDPEAIPYLWTDAVPYYAAFLALDSFQTEARAADAQRRYQQYQQYVARARAVANPDLLKWQYPQSTDPAQIAKYGLKQQVGQKAAG